MAITRFSGTSARVDENYRILGQSQAQNFNAFGDRVAQDVYIVPDNTSAKISSISIINNGSTGFYKLGVIKSDNIDEEKAINPKIISFISGALAYSEDGINWETSSMPANESWHGPIFENNMFVAISRSSNVGAYSTNGINWILTPMPTSGYRDLAYGNGKFVTVTLFGGNAAHSTDGITWIPSKMPSSDRYISIAYGQAEGIFVAIAEFSDTAAYSTDGITWTAIALPSNQTWSSIAYGSSRFVAVSSSSNASAYSFNGINWAAGQVTSITSHHFNNISYVNNMFWALRKNGNTFYYSTQGSSNWSLTNVPSSEEWSGIVYAGNKYVAVSYTANQFNILYSTNGTTWTGLYKPELIGTSFSYASINYANNTNTLTDSLKTIENNQVIVPTKIIESGQVEEFVGDIELSEGESIRIYSENPDIYVHVYGSEYS